MRKDILGFDQKKAIDDGLDIKDLILLRFIFKGINEKLFLKKNIYSETFYLVNMSDILVDYPILDLKTKGSVRRRLKKLVDKGYLNYKLYLSGGKYTFYNITNLTKKLYICNGYYSKNRENKNLKGNKFSNDVIKEEIYKSLPKSSNSKEKILALEDYLFKGLEELEKRYVNCGDIQEIRTGYKSLDELNSIKKGELVIVAGRHSMGKTIFALNLLDKLADNNYNVLLHELQMSEDDVSMSLFSSRLNIENELIKSGKLSEEQFITLIDEYQRMIKRGNAFIDFGNKYTFLSISTKAKTMKQTKGLDVLIIDYLGLMDIDLKDTRTNSVGEITRGLKLLAKELNISIVLLCQLSRAVEGRIDKRPMLSDLRDSGNIDQDADVVIFTYREKYYDKKLKEDKLELIVGKNRNGKTGTIKLDFYPEYQKIA